MQSIEQLLTQLIMFRTTASRPDERAACAIWIAQQLSANQHLTVTPQRFGDVDSLVITKNQTTTTTDTSKPHVMLYAHYDVVDGDDADFLPQMTSDQIIGRGSMDMKAGLAVFMHLIDELAATDANISMIIVGDEEVGGFNGTERLIKGRLIQAPDVVIIPDGGMKINNIILREKGVLKVTLQATGTPTHSSQNWNGQSAIDSLISAIQKIQTHFIPTDQHPDDHWVNTFNVGIIEGGRAFNQVAATASAMCDIRLIETTEPAAMLSELQQLLPQNVNLIQDLECTAFAVTKDNKFIQHYADTLQHHDLVPEFGRSHGGSDARFFSEIDIPAIIAQPDGVGHHGENEWVSRQALSNYEQIIKDFIQTVH